MAAKHVKSDVIESALSFFDEQSKFKSAKAEFEKKKLCFYGEMKDYFHDLNEDSRVQFDLENFDGQKVKLIINRVQKSSVIFDADKIENSVCKEAVIKTYSISDIHGLIEYLKSCGVSPSKFKSFLTVTKSVDTNLLERYEERGIISKEQLDGCYVVKSQEPYFTVSVRKGQHDE